MDEGGARRRSARNLHPQSLADAGRGFLMRAASHHARAMRMTIPHLWTALLRRPRVLILVVGLAGFIAPMTYGLLTGLQEPRIHDEFSYLLGAETFAAGRLTNAPHPLWRHFETFHVLSQPTYMTKYPPASSLVLAAGIKLGHRVIGLWLATAAMAAATCWMLLGWVPRRWAVAGSIIVILLFGTLGPWAQGYWGGAVAATGGALLFGALPRVLRGARVVDGALLGLGLLILANARPFEGLMLALLAGAAFLWRWRERGRRLERLVRTAVSAGVVLSVGGAAMLAYNHAVMGDAFTFPYQAYQRAYDPNPVFFFLSPIDVREDLPPRFDRFNERFSMERFNERQGVRGWGHNVADLLAGFRTFYFSTITLGAIFLTLPWLAARRRGRVILGILAAFLLIESLPVWWNPHYTAGATAIVVLLSVEALRHLNVMRYAGRARIPAGWLLAIFVFEWGQLNIPIGTVLRGLVGRRDPGVAAVVQPDADTGAIIIRGAEYPDTRIAATNYLLGHGGRHVAIVDYGPSYPVSDEWVYNAADIDASPLIWAHEIGRRTEIMEYFADRHLWSVHVARDSVRIMPIAPSR